MVGRNDRLDRRPADEPFDSAAGTPLGSARTVGKRVADPKRGAKSGASSASAADRSVASVAMTPIRPLKDRRDSDSDGGSVWTRVSAPTLASPSSSKVFSSWSARAWCIADESTGKVLLSHNADLCLQVCSLPGYFNPRSRLMPLRCFRMVAAPATHALLCC